MDKDPLEARKLFTKASKNGDSVSENNLGYMKQHGIGMCLCFVGWDCKMSMD